MAQRPLGFDFPLMTPPIARDGQDALLLSIRPPHTVPLDELLLDLEEERDRRRQLYPKWVNVGRITIEEANHHRQILAQILDDLTPPAPSLSPAAYRRHQDEQAERASASPHRWADKVRELRREIALRRKAYPKWIGENRMAEADVRRSMERIEAAHWRYWIRLDHFDASDSELPLRERLQPIRDQAAAVEAWLVHAHHSGDPAIAGYEPAMIAWLADQAETKAAA